MPEVTNVKKTLRCSICGDIRERVVALIQQREEGVVVPRLAWRCTGMGSCGSRHTEAAPVAP